MKFKKICLLFTLAFSLTACGSNDHSSTSSLIAPNEVEEEVEAVGDINEVEEDIKDVEEVVEVSVRDNGTFDEATRTYTNNKFGISFTVPDDWEITTQETIDNWSMYDGEDLVMALSANNTDNSQYISISLDNDPFEPSGSYYDQEDIDKELKILEEQGRTNLSGKFDSQKFGGSDFDVKYIGHTREDITTYEITALSYKDGVQMDISILGDTEAYALEVLEMLK